jgi:hypothetical protein
MSGWLELEKSRKIAAFSLSPTSWAWRLGAGYLQSFVSALAMHFVSLRPRACRVIPGSSRFWEEKKRKEGRRIMHSAHEEHRMTIHSKRRVPGGSSFGLRCHLQITIEETKTRAIDYVVRRC